MRSWVGVLVVVLAALAGGRAEQAAAAPEPVFDPTTDVDYQLGGAWDAVPDHEDRHPGTHPVRVGRSVGPVGLEPTT